MCSVSVVHDYFRQQTSPHEWNRDKLNEYKEIIKRLEKLDEHFNQPDCEDPLKTAWVREVEARLEKLETES